MESPESVKIEIIYGSESGELRINSPPVHRTLESFWGGHDGVKFPYVVEASTEEADRLFKAFVEYRWAQNRLCELARGLPPKNCACGNCPSLAGY
ncbi:MAG: hypothetical protein Q7R91_02800 [bacterium]|nr:hypothetical protein [bacterium]